MKEIAYRSFSWRIHKKNLQLRKSNLCQLELTFGCDLHCKHCYSDCYNKPAYLKKELKTSQVKTVLDKVYEAGVIWLCFTGGDPLTRKDFKEIYSYAKGKGFIIIIFTNAYSMTKNIAAYLKANPPFVIEITLNGVTNKTVEKITQVKGSFRKIMQGLTLIEWAKLPLKIKTLITKDNLRELPRIRNFIDGLGLAFYPSYDLFARLNGDSAVCGLRIPTEEIVRLNGYAQVSKDGCPLPQARENSIAQTSEHKSDANLFRCVIGGGGTFPIDPYGNTFLCNLIRRPAFNLLSVDIGYAFNKLLPVTINKKFVTDSKCNNCNFRDVCRWCPGKAYLEKGEPEAPIDYYCRLAESMH